MDLREITDFNAPELDVYARLTENQLVNRADPANALFIAESPLVIGRALDAGCVPVSFLMERKHVEGKASELLAWCPADIPVYAAPLEVLEQLTGFKLTRGMLCAMRRPKLPTVEQVCAGARRVAVLENVMNPTNIGAIFRSAAALNMDAMALLNDIVGGVTVTIEDDFSGYDDSLKMGETITLDGQQAYHYLRGRMSVGDGANTSRMRRQRTYMTEFLKKAQRQLADDKNMANTLYNELTPYMVTDLSGNDVSTLLETSQYYSSRGIITPEGTVKRGGTFVEFYADEAALKELVLSLYYEKK